MSRLRVVHVIASIADAASGPSYSVPRLAAALAVQGVETSLHTVDGWRGEIAGTGGAIAGLDVHRQDFSRFPMLSRLCASRALSCAITLEARKADVVHGHGLWLMPNVYPARAARRLGKPLMMSPRGMLGPEALRFSRGRKRIFWHAFQKEALHSAACLHATSEQEHREIRAAGLTNPVAVVPNGIDIPDTLPIPPIAQSGVILSLGRIHPKKGLDRLVRAWAQLEADHPSWSVRIVGPNENGHATELQALAAQLGLRRLVIEKPLFGAAKLTALRAAALFVLPTLNENFAMTVAEALAAGTPVITTKGAPWNGLKEHRCGWWIDHGVAPLATALRQALALPEGDRQAMGRRGRAWMANDFSWHAVGEAMRRTYEWLTRDTARPNFVHLA